MNLYLLRWLKRVPRLLEAPAPEPAQHQRRILTLQRHVVLPAKLVVIGVVFYSLFFSEWVGAVPTTYAVVLKTMQNLFEVYIFLNLFVAVSFYVVRHWPAGFVQWVVFAIGLADGLFLGGLTLLTGGFDSILYWCFPGLILLNAICIPLATPQIVLNLMLSAFFLIAGMLEPDFRNVELTLPQVSALGLPKRLPALTPEDLPEPTAFLNQLRARADPVSRLLWARFGEKAQQKLTSLAEAETDPKALSAALVEELNSLMPQRRYVYFPETSAEAPENPAEPFLLRLVLLWLFTACCYGVQVLAVRQELAEEEQKEFAARTEQLHAAGRLAAEFAHQLKNPLAIINNTVFSLQRRLREDQGESAPQIQIIQEEVEKADRIITQVMGYAQLSEGRVEKLHVVEELDLAIERVFPAGSQYGTELRRDYAAHFPPLLMQRAHLAEIFVNLLQNARDVLDGRGHITVTARCRGDYAVEVAIADDGPGIPADKLERVFEAYYTTRPKGTGLGLAIVKHNIELYGGTVCAESELGKGARFTVVFPATTAIKLGK